MHMASNGTGVARVTLNTIVQTFLQVYNTAYLLQMDRDV